ncbi:MAG: hypothetical protein WCS77_10520 [Elusimicrobiaceae bacterium]
MKKIMTMLAVLIALPAFSHAADMTGKFGLGLRNDQFSARYFVNNSFATELGTAFSYVDTDNLGITRDYNVLASIFYVREIHEDILLEAGITATYLKGTYNNNKFNEYVLSPFIGMETIIKGHFGLDFKVIPFSFDHYDCTGLTTKGYFSMHGSLGAHYYF